MTLEDSLSPNPNRCQHPLITQRSLIYTLHCFLFFLRLWKKTQYCPECNICFGREKAGDRGKDLFDKNSEVEYAYCWVCSRQHHAKCIGEVSRFICQACQQRTQSKCTALAGNVTTVTSEITAGTCFCVFFVKTD